MSVWEAFAAAGAALVTGVLGYLLRRRLASGTVQTSDAQTLWREAEVIRKGLADRVVHLEGQVDDRDRRIDELEDQLRRGAR